jgi:hypothetical protein
VPEALGADAATGGNGDGHLQRHARALVATHEAADLGPGSQPDRCALDPQAGPPAPAVLVPAPLEVEPSNINRDLTHHQSGAHHGRAEAEK